MAMSFEEFGRDYPTHPRRCKQCGAALMLMNRSDTCWPCQIKRNEQATVNPGSYDADFNELYAQRWAELNALVAHPHTLPSDQKYWLLFFEKQNWPHKMERATVGPDHDRMFALDYNCHLCCNVVNEVRLGDDVIIPPDDDYRCPRHTPTPAGRRGLEGGAA